MSNPTQSPWSLVVHLSVRATVLLGLGIASGVALNHFRPNRFAASAYEPPTTCAGSESAADTDFRPIEVMPPEQVASLCGAKGVVIVDVRDHEQFAAGHVVHALHLPCTASADDAKNAMTLLSSNHTLVVYGSRTDNTTRVAESLREQANRFELRIVTMEGGFEAWNEAGLACASGACEDCREEAKL